MMKKVLGLIFLIAWVAGEAPRLVWKEAPPIRPMDAAAGGLAMFWVLEAIVNKSYKDYKNYIHKNKGILAIAGTLAASWILGLRLWPLEGALAGLLYLLRTLVYFWLIWRAKEILGKVRQWIPAAMAAFVGLGLLQYAFLPDTRFLLQYGWDEHYWRLIGTVLDPNYFGVMAGMIVFWAIKNYKGYKNHNFWLAAAAFAGLVLTWSRASWLSFVAAAGWWGILGRSGRLGRLGILGILGVLGLGVWWAAPKPGGEGVNLLRTSSIEQRLTSWNEAVGVWREHPWLGVGFNNYKVAQVAMAPSSSWLLLLATLGILGSLGILGGIVKIGAIGEMKNSKFWLGIIIMVSVHAIFNNTLFYPPILGLLALLRVTSLR